MSKLKNGLVALAVSLVVACGGSKIDGDSGSKDGKAPAFDGIVSAEPLANGWTQVSWSPADDDVSKSARIVYRVYAGRAGLGVDFKKPVAVSPSGASTIGVPRLPLGVELDLAVRSVDESGNEDKGTKTITITLPDPAPPQFAGVTEVVGVSGSAVEVKWPDPREGPAVTGYLVYLSQDPLGLTATKARKVAANKRSLVIDDLKEATLYYAAVRAGDPSGGDDGNRKFASGSTLDVTAPEFAGLISATPGGTAVRLVWPEASDLISASGEITYNIYAAEGASDFDFTAPLVSLKGVTTVLQSGLTASTAFRFIVRAADAAGNEDDNVVEVSATTGASADTTPPIFAGLGSAAPKTSLSILLSWTAASDDLTATESIVYDIWYATLAGEEAISGPPDATSAPGATSYEFGDLDPNTQYYFLVRARNIAELVDGNVVEKTAKTKSDDDAPVFAGLGSITGLNATTVQLDWPAAVDAFPSSNVTYDVFFTASSGGENYSTPYTSVTGSLSLVIGGLSRNTTYYAVVRARDPDGNAETNSNEIAGATLPDTTGPVLSSAPSLTALNQTSIKIDWAAAIDDSYPAAQLRYQVYFATAVNGPFTARPLLAAGIRTDTITDLTVNTQYWVYVVPRDGIPNLGSATPKATVMTSTDTGPPTAPGTLSFTATTSGGANTVNLSWGAASDDFTPVGSIRYEICRATSASGCSPFVFYTSTGPGVTTASLPSQTLDTHYYYAVRAYDLPGIRGVIGNVVGDTAAPATPAAPYPYDATAIYSSTYYAYWTKVTDDHFTNLRYRVEYWAVASAGCSFNWVALSTLGPYAPGADSYFGVPAYVAGNYPRIVAIDGFGNEAQSAYLNAPSSGTAAQILQPLWNGQCNLGTGCHGGTYVAWTPATAKLSPSPVSNATPAVVVASNVAGSRMNTRVVQGTMPPGGGASEALICNLQRWIGAGVP